MSVQVSIIMGSDSDFSVMTKAAQTLKDFGVEHETKVISAHRTPELMQEYALQAKAQGIKVIIAGAGGAAHLPGMVASLTVLPVIGVPVSLKNLDGLDSLLSIAQMPKGVPVATVAIDNAINAAILAVRILAISDEKLSLKLDDFRQLQKQKVTKANENIGRS
jgi:5-(carboxyamino)imidazole ribonucleotide mutase